MPFKNTLEAIEARLVPTENGCLLWPGCKSNTGYGSVGYQRKVHNVHTLMYEWKVGPVPEGLQLHHRLDVCGNRTCANPDHLEPLTPKEHRRRHWKTHCPQGHPYAEGFVNNQGRQQCRVCHRRSDVRRYWKQKIDKEMP